eukprot:gene17542-biopygen815
MCSRPRSTAVSSCWRTALASHPPHWLVKLSLGTMVRKVVRATRQHAAVSKWFLRRWVGRPAVGGGRRSHRAAVCAQHGDPPGVRTCPRHARATQAKQWSIARATPAPLSCDPREKRHCPRPARV